MNRSLSLTWTVRWLLLAVGAGVCPAPLQAQSHDIARAIELQGQVSVIRGAGQVALFQASGGVSSANSTVAAKEIIVTGLDGYAKFQIEDGSTFEVFPNSRVTFRQTFTPMEMLDVLLGKIRVMIEHRNGPNPRKVSTPTAVISVRGTVFDVAVEDLDGTTLVSVEEGRVQVDHRLQPNSQPRILNQYDSVRVYPNQPLAKAGGPSPGAVRFIFDRIRAAVDDILLNNPGGVGLPGGRGGNIPGNGQADGTKDKKGPPAGTPPAGPPPPPPGGGN